MEFATTGAQCHHCRQRDYLPFTCKYCSNQFCLSHRTAESHECSSLAAASQKSKEDAAASLPPPPPANLPVKYKCHHQGCKIRELQPIHCRNCGHSHCIKHRFPTSHACEAFGSRNGVSRNTILPAGVIAPRPIDANGSTDSSTLPIATLPAKESVPRFTAAQFTSAITSFFASAASSSVASSAAPVPPVAVESATASSSASAPPVAAVAAVESSPLVLRNVSGANSCAAEVAASAAAMSSSSVESSISASSTSASSASSTTANINSESTSSSVPPAARRTNTNVAHLSKLLKQRS